jgi:hypothetical protein
MVEWRLDGLDRVVARIGDLNASMLAAAARELNEVAEEAMTESKNQVPVDTGRLRSTGNVAQHATPRNLEVILAYGTDYALLVHQTHPRGGKGYLIRPVQTAAATLPENLARAMGKAGAGGARTGGGRGLL